MNNKVQPIDLIAPCGMNCRLCVSYQAGLYDINRQGYQKRYCPGCIPRGKHCTFMKKTCQVITKGKARLCLECADYPCRRLKDLDARYRKRYGMSMIENLTTIKEKGILALMKDEAIKWACPSCGELMCCHTHTCIHCESEKNIERHRTSNDD